MTSFMSLKFSGLPIVKLTATGNDFLLVDLMTPKAALTWKRFLLGRSLPKVVRELCDRHFGLGADGFVIISPSPKADFTWDFFNNDGGKAGMCGNAARAVSLYASKILKKRSITFITKIGKVSARVYSTKNIAVQLPPIKAYQPNQRLSYDGSKIRYDFVEAGVPHATVESPLNNREKMVLRAYAIKSLRCFKKAGTNVTFFKKISKNSIASVTFERGVEDFTLSCGTGAIASAFSFMRGKSGARVSVEVPGGKLRVHFTEKGPILSGPARIVAKINLYQGE